MEDRWDRHRMAATDHAVAWTQLFGALDRAGLALHLQIRRAIVVAIERRVLTPEARLPSSRQLASLLGVARNTVVAAYQQLIDEGFLVSQERSGIFLAPGAEAPEESPTRPKTCLDWSGRLAIRPSRLPQITKPRDWLDYPYPFVFGQFDPSLFPANDWRESVRAASSVAEINGWAGDLIDEDDADLVEQLRLQVLPRRGIFAGVDEVMITIGSQQALSLLTRLLVGHDTPAGIEDPCYPDTRNMLGLATSDLAPLTIDRHGVVPDSAFASRDIAFVTVGHHCPTTAVMPLGRRQALLHAARRHDVLLVEDDYEADLAVEGEIPSLKSLDADGRVIYVGSFSKVLAPGLRIGYVVAPGEVIAELRVLRRLMLRHPPSNNQRATAMFVALGHYRSHLRRTAAALEERATCIGSLLPRLLPGCRWRRDPGATSFWIEGPQFLDARDLTERARARGVLIEPGDIFFADPRAGRACFRLGFTSIRTDRIEAGLSILSELVVPAGPSRPRVVAERV
ncbi:aspartate aminotransferase [Streptomyces purpurogeneiscleroticus]|nr:aspartate aminotransferase [Streptomyces purpurogeneiscleroticus]